MRTVAKAGLYLYRHPPRPPGRHPHQPMKSWTERVDELSTLDSTLLDRRVHTDAGGTCRSSRVAIHAAVNPPRCLLFATAGYNQLAAKLCRPNRFFIERYAKREETRPKQRISRNKVTAILGFATSPMRVPLPLRDTWFGRQFKKKKEKKTVEFRARRLPRFEAREMRFLNRRSAVEKAATYVDREEEDESRSESMTKRRGSGRSRP